MLILLTVALLTLIAASAAMNNKPVPVKVRNRRK